MRYLVGLVCLLALGAMPLVGCSDSEGTGGSGGEGGMAGMVEPPALGAAEKRQRSESCLWDGASRCPWRGSRCVSSTPTTVG